MFSKPNDQIKFYIQCPNIVASMYSQRKLSEIYGFTFLKSTQTPFESDKFLVLYPPIRYQKYVKLKSGMPILKTFDGTKEMPLIMQGDKVELNANFIPMLDALKDISVLEKLRNNSFHVIIKP